MANPHRGEEALKADGQSYTLKYSLNSLCDLEDELDMSVVAMAEMLDDPARMSLKVLRLLIWIGLREHHPDLTVEDAGRIAQKIGIIATAEKVGAAFQAAFPQEEQGTGKARPKKALR